MFTTFLVFVLILCAWLAYSAFKVDPEKIKSLEEIQDRMNMIRKLKEDMDTAEDGYQITQINKLREIEIALLMDEIANREARWYFKFKLKNPADPLNRMGR